MKSAPSRPTPDGSPRSSSAHAERCRTLIAHAASATLSTIAREPAGYPFGSLVAVAFDDEGAPLLLLSRLAEHTQNLAAREEASILVVEPAEGADPLATGRLSILGRCRPMVGDRADAARARFLAKHPEAEPYAGFSDFAMYRLEPSAIRYVGGFGRMSWVDIDRYRSAREP